VAGTPSAIRICEPLLWSLCVTVSQTGSLIHNTSHEEFGTQVSTGEPDRWNFF